MKKKIIVLVFLSVAEISYFSWRTIVKDNRQPIVHQEKKNDRQEKDEDSPENIQDDHQEKNYFWLGIIIGIILFLFIAVLIYVFIKRNGKPKEEDEKSVHSLNSIKTIHSKIKQPKLKDKYNNWVCGVKINGDKMQLIFCENWNVKDFVNQIFQMDITPIEKNGDDRLKKFYDEKINNELQTKNIKNFLNYNIEFLNYLKAPFFEKIKELNFQKTLKNKNNNGDNNKDNNDNKENDDDNILSKLASNFRAKIKNKHDNNPIVLNEIDIPKDIDCAILISQFDNKFENFDQIDLWKFFKSLTKEDNPMAYFYKKNENDLQETAVPLFKYSVTLSYLILPIVKKFKNIVSDENVKKQIFADNEINEIQNSLNKLEKLEHQEE